MTSATTDPAGLLDEAMVTATAIGQDAVEAAVTMATAYDVQRDVVARRLGRGERQVGVKMGFTSIAKQQQMGLSDVIIGRLTDAMAIADGGATPRARYIHPRAEPEIAFRLGASVHGTIDRDEAIAAIDGIAAAIEVIDSRFANFRFSLPTVIADNASSAGFVVGDWRPPAAEFPDLTDLSIDLAVDGTVVETGSSAAILGDPLLSLIAAARLAGEQGAELPAGSIVLAGGATAAVAVDGGETVSVDVATLGGASFTLER